MWYLNWIKNEIIFLSLATLIQRFDKNHLISRTKHVQPLKGNAHKNIYTL